MFVKGGADALQSKWRRGLKRGRFTLFLVERDCSAVHLNMATPLC